MIKRMTLASIRSLAALILVLGAVSARAELFAVDTPSTVLNINSITLGDYQIVPTPGPANLIDGTPDFVVVNEFAGESLVLSRVDGAMFDLDSIIVQGTFSAMIGGVRIYPNFGGFQEYFVDLKGVTSVTMRPFGSIAPSVAALQFSAFHDAPHLHDALIWATSDTGDIISVNTVTGTTVTIGNAGITLSDIALDSNGDLWGVTRFGGLYSINTTTGLASLTSAINVFELNALVSDGAGGLFAADQFGDFFTINTTTGVATLIGNMGVGSAGDLEFANSTLYLSAVSDISNPTVPNQLWTVDPATGAANLVGSFGVPDMFGLAFERGVMWGLEGTNVYSIDLATGAATLSASYYGPSAAFGATGMGTSAQTFSDVPTDYWAFSFIEVLAASGITAGCGGGNYCPEDVVTRAQMAVFLERGMNGSSFVPPLANGNLFLDVSAGDFAANFIEQLFTDGVTAGCGNNNYCPNDAVSRSQMAVFLLRAKYGSAYSPPAATGVFGDVDLSYWAAAWIEQLAAESITAGCGNGNYCPDDAVTRDQMAVFLVRTFGL